MRSRPQRRREDGHGRRPRRGDHARGGDPRDRAGVPRRLRRDRRGGARLERQRQAHRRSASTSRTSSAARTSSTSSHGGGLWQLRPDRHGGLVDDRRHAPALPRAARGRARQPRRRPPGAAAADARRRPRARRPAPERAPLQGHLPRAGRDRVHRLRGGARELPPLPRRAPRRRLLRRRRDARRVADRGVARADLAAGARAARVRAADAARRARGAARRARRGGPPAARLRPLRRALVRLLAAAAAGEPRDGGDDRARDGGPRPRPRPR